MFSLNLNFLIGKIGIIIPDNRIMLHYTKHLAQCPVLLKCSVSVKFYVFVIVVPGNAVGAPDVADYKCHIKLKT